MGKRVGIDVVYWLSIRWENVSIKGVVEESYFGCVSCEIWAAKEKYCSSLCDILWIREKGERRETGKV